MLPKLLRKSDYFLSLGDRTDEYLKHYGATQEQLIRCPPAVARGLWPNDGREKAALRQRIRERHRIPNDHSIVLMVGRFAKCKRQIDLAEAANRWHARGERITVMLAGSGERHDEVRRTALRKGAGGVVCTGFIAPENLPGYYHAADIYAHTATTEPHGIAIAEAAYAGLPLIVTDTCGAQGSRSTAQVGRNAVLYRGGKTDELEERINRLHTHPKERCRMGQESTVIATAQQEAAHTGAIEQLLDLTRARRRKAE